MGVYQQGTAPKEEKSIFPPDAKVVRIITHDMQVVGDQLRVNVEDDPDFRAKCAKMREELEAAKEKS